MNRHCLAQIQHAKFGVQEATGRVHDDTRNGSSHTCYLFFGMYKFAFDTLHLFTWNREARVQGSDVSDCSPFRGGERICITMHHVITFGAIAVICHALFMYGCRV